MPGGSDWGPQDGQYLDNQDEGQYLDQGAPGWQGGDGGVDDGQGWDGHPGPARGYGGVPQRSPQGTGNNGFARGGVPGQQWGGPVNGVMPPPQQMPYGGPMGGSARAARRQGSSGSQPRPGPGPGRGGDDLYDSDGAAGHQGWGHQPAPPQQQGLPPQGGPPPYHPQAMGPKSSSRSHSFGTEEEQWYPDGGPGNGRGPIPPQGQGLRGGGGGGGEMLPPANPQKMGQYKSSMRRPQLPMDGPGGPGQVQSADPPPQAEFLLCASSRRWPSHVPVTVGCQPRALSRMIFRAA